MMKKLLNPFRQLEGYNCFGCSDTNPIGLKLDFYEDGEDIVAHYNPDPNFQGWKNVLHGGIQSTIMDELASWVVFVKCATSGVTANLHVRYKKPVFTTNKDLEVRGRLIKVEKRIAYIDVELLNDEKEVCATAKAEYFIYPKQVAQKKFFFKGKDSFYPEESEKE